MIICVATAAVVNVFCANATVWTGKDLDVMAKYVLCILNSALLYNEKTFNSLLLCE